MIRKALIAAVLTVGGLAYAGPAFAQAANMQNLPPSFDLYQPMVFTVTTANYPKVQAALRGWVNLDDQVNGAAQGTSSGAGGDVTFSYTYASNKLSLVLLAPTDNTNRSNILGRVAGAINNANK